MACLLSVLLAPYARGHRVLGGFTCVAIVGASDLLLSGAKGYESMAWIVFVSLFVISVPWIAAFGAIAWARAVRKSTPNSWEQW